MYDINTKRNGHTRVRRAAVAQANIIDPVNLFAQTAAQEILNTTNGNNFIGKAVKKLTSSVIKGGLNRAERKVAEKVGPEKAAEMRASVEHQMKTNPDMVKQMKSLNRMGNLVATTALIGGAIVAAPIIAGAAGVGGASAGVSSVGAGATVSASEAVGAGATLLGAGKAAIKSKSSADLTKGIAMPNSTSINKILAPIAEQGLKASGKVVSGNSASDKVRQFLQDVVGPQTGQDLKGLAGDVAEKAMVDFISTLRNKKLNGEKLPAALDKIADLTIRAENKAEEKIKQAAAGNIGEWVMTNWWVILIALALLYLAANRSNKN